MGWYEHPFAAIVWENTQPASSTASLLEEENSSSSAKVSADLDISFLLFPPPILTQFRMQNYVWVDEFWTELRNSSYLSSVLHETNGSRLSSKTVLTFYLKKNKNQLNIWLSFSSPKFRQPCSVMYAGSSAPAICLWLCSEALGRKICRKAS